MDKIVLKDVNKIFETKRQTTHALKDININIPEESIVGIVGPSGCGKSTIIRMLINIIKPTSGDIIVDGFNYEGGENVPKSIIRKMGFVFQRPNLLPWLTLRENIAFPQKIVGLKGQEWDDYVNELLEMALLMKCADLRPSELSGGMLQRAGVLRAMAIKPEILLMDEPFGALDDLLREQLDLYTLDIWEKEKQTIIFITHNVREAILMSSKIYVMSTGPGEIIKEVPIDIPYPRDLSILTDPKFIEYEKYITSLIGEIDLSEII